jgi:hypothetical protein
MGLDIKFPIGLMFTIFGVMISIYGFVTNGNIELYKSSLGININIWSGLLMLIFGLAMLVPALLKRKKKKTF